VAQNSLYPFLDLKASAGLNGLGDHYGNDLDQLTSKDFYSWQVKVCSDTLLPLIK